MSSFAQMPEGLGSLFRLVPVPWHHVRATGDNFPDRFRWHFPIMFVHNFQYHAPRQALLKP
jgi:hypothetical protein